MPKVSPQTAPPLPPELLKQLQAINKVGNGKTAPPNKASNGDLLDGYVSDQGTAAAAIKTNEPSSTSDNANHSTDSPTQASSQKTSFWCRLFKPLIWWWQHKWLRRVTILLLLVAILLGAALPKTRYFLLNSAGVRSSLSLSVIDGSTQQPLKNVTVSLSGVKTQTNANGIARLEHLKLGPGSLTIERLAFAPISQPITVGWGSNPLGTFTLKPTGLQYTIRAVDFLSGKPIPAAAADNDGIDAQADKDGKMVLTMDEHNLTDFPATISAPGYRSEQIIIQPSAHNQVNVTLVPSDPAVFISKQSGKYDLYRMDIDGKNKQLLLAGTGNENSNIALAVSPDGSEVALVSTRDNLRSGDGYLLSALTLVNLTTKSATTIDHSEQISLITWRGNKLVYELTAAGASAANPGRYRLVDYDYTANRRLQLASANQFNSVIAGPADTIYYAIANTDPLGSPGFFSINLDGNAKQTIFGHEVWTAFRTDYQTIALQTPDGWFDYKIGGPPALAKITAPGTYSSRNYTMNNTASLAAYVENRDGKGALVTFSPTLNKETILATGDGLIAPVRWTVAGDAVFYRISNSNETADYIVSINGGAPHKLTDVTNTYSFAQVF